MLDHRPALRDLLCRPEVFADFFKAEFGAHLPLDPAGLKVRNIGDIPMADTMDSVLMENDTAVCFLVLTGYRNGFDRTLPARMAFVQAFLLNRAADALDEDLLKATRGFHVLKPICPLVLYCGTAQFPDTPYDIHSLMDFGGDETARAFVNNYAPLVVSLCDMASEKISRYRTDLRLVAKALSICRNLDHDAIRSALLEHPFFQEEMDSVTADIILDLLGFPCPPDAEAPGENSMVRPGPRFCALYGHSPAPANA